MRIRSLGIFGYRGRDDCEWDESFPQPSWSDVEVAIRRLDANNYAGVSISLEGMYADSGDQPSLHITGGQGQYVVAYSGGGGSSVHYVDSAMIAEEEWVGVVTRDQGVYVPARSVCRDLELVLAIARHLAETGGPYPSVVWE